MNCLIPAVVAIRRITSIAYPELLLRCVTVETSIWKAWSRHAQGKKIVVKNNYDYTVWWSERKVTCMVPTVGDVRCRRSTAMSTFDHGF